MAKNITLLGADYPDVPAVQLPQTGGGTATFYDIENSKTTYTPTIPRITYSELARNDAVCTGNLVMASARFKVNTSQNSNTYIDASTIPKFGKTLGVGFGVWHDETADAGGVLHWSNNDNIWLLSGSGQHMNLVNQVGHVIYIAFSYYLL